MLLTDPRGRPDRLSGSPHIVNDEACLDRLLESVMEQLWERVTGGCWRRSACRRPWVWVRCSTTSTHAAAAHAVQRPLRA
ncbi:MAG: hypothetical protein R2838_08375 [Caldilineaceae bacterium]